MRKDMKPLAWTWVIATVVACGGQTVLEAVTPADAATDLDAAPLDAAILPDAGGSDGSDGKASAEDKFCQAAASRAACPNGPVTCRESDKCQFARNTSAAAFDVFVKCWGGPGCGGEDACLAQAGEAVGGQSARDYVSACLEKVAECRGGFDDDYCSAGLYAYAGAGAAAAACLTKPCAEQGTCLEAVETSFVKRGCFRDAGR
jgi:hypothetical protein